VTEYISFGTRYSLVQDNLTLDKDLFFTDPDFVPDPDGDGPLTSTTGPEPFQCDPNRVGRYLCDELGKRITSSLGYTVAFDSTNGVRATRGQRIVFGQDFAGLGGDVKYLRTRGDATKYFGLPKGFVLSAHIEGGYIHALQSAPGPGRDAIRLNDRFFGAQLRGFDIRGIGPRIQRFRYVDTDGTLDTARRNIVSDSLGGRAYYMGRVEVEFPTNSTLKNLGLRPSAFVDVGSVWGVTRPELAGDDGKIGICATPSLTDTDPDAVLGTPCPTGTTFVGGFKEFFQGNSPKPRVSVGIGVNWVSPFGPLRLDVAKALVKQEGDDTKLFSFNVGTQF
jgi:outer membrane protein insertion porin family